MQHIPTPSTYLAPEQIERILNRQVISIENDYMDRLIDVNDSAITLYRVLHDLHTNLNMKLDPGETVAHYLDRAQHSNPTYFDKMEPGIKHWFEKNKFFG